MSRLFPVRGRAAVVLLGAAVASGVLTGCGSGSGTSTPAASTAPGTGTASPAASTAVSAASTTPSAAGQSASSQGVTLPVTIANGHVGPNDSTISVRKGQQVTVSITSDRATEVHVHGYDLEIEAVPGQVVRRTFTTDRTGTFEIETHDPAFTVYELQVD